MDNNTIGYFLAYSGIKRDIKVLVEIEIPPNAKTNLNREGIFDKLNAQYKTNNYIVKKIYDEQLNEYSVFFKNRYVKNKVRKLNENVFVKNYKTDNSDNDNNSETDNSLYDGDRGYKDAATFYLTKNRAFGKICDKQGKCIVYHKNGHKKKEYYFTKFSYSDEYYSYKTGKYYFWSKNGILLKDLTYSGNKLNGECKYYDKTNGKIKMHVIYKNNVITEYLYK